MVSRTGAERTSVREHRKRRNRPFAGRPHRISLEHAGFVLQLVDQFGDALDLDARLAAARLLGLDHLQPRLDVGAVVGRALLVERLLLGFHDVGQRGIARLVEAKIRGDNRRHLQFHRLQAAIDLARHLGLVAIDNDLGSKSALRPAQKCGQHLAGLVRIVVDRLLAENDKTGLFRLDHALQHLGDTQRLRLLVGLDQDGAVGTHGQRGAQRLLRLLRPDRDNDDLFRLAGLLQPDRLFDRDLVERVHRHLDVGEFHRRTVSLHTNLHIRIHNPLHGHKDLHLPVTSFTIATSFKIVGRAIAVCASSELSKADIPDGILVSDRLKRVAFDRPHATRFRLLFYACRYRKTAAHFCATCIVGKLP
ncbi:hypothetical protein BQ8482_240050 [Mesorhizobium delmotii]|uniref:NAD-specific glutamate dehydrogenase n=1 Tax=Mesorhizobium delmotii TaxID=1631247 RepID=A0A2P9ALT0_9HYPH|nr:hypothetical protein BQ8482_240050 [Mesorhizobium delmotii]